VSICLLAELAPGSSSVSTPGLAFRNPISRLFCDSVADSISRSTSVLVPPVMSLPPTLTISLPNFTSNLSH
jgi:hypothetical protein